MLGYVIVFKHNMSMIKTQVQVMIHDDRHRELHELRVCILCFKMAIALDGGMFTFIRKTT